MMAVVIVTVNNDGCSACRYSGCSYDSNGDVVVMAVVVVVHSDVGDECNGNGCNNLLLAAGSAVNGDSASNEMPVMEMV